MAAPSVAALQDVATQLRIDSVASTSRRRQRPPDDVPVGRRHHGGAVLLGDAIRSEESPESRQRSLRPVERACGPDPLRRLGRGRSLPARAADGAAHLRIGSRRAPDAAAALRRRGDGLARTGHLCGDRHRAERAADRLGVSHLRPARRRRDCRGLGVGSRRRGLSLQAGQPVRNRRRQRARPEPGDRVRPRPEPHRGPVERIRLEGAGGRRPRHRRRSRRDSTRRARPAVGRPSSWRGR